jgi:hypothetical protein
MPSNESTENITTNPKRFKKVVTPSKKPQPSNTKNGDVQNSHKSKKFGAFPEQKVSTFQQQKAHQRKDKPMQKTTEVAPEEEPSSLSFPLDTNDMGSKNWQAPSLDVVVEMSDMDHRIESFIRNKEISVTEFWFQIPQAAITASQRTFGVPKEKCLEKVRVRVEKTVVGRRNRFEGGFKTGLVYDLDSEEIASGNFEHVKTFGYLLKLDYSLTDIDQRERTAPHSKKDENQPNHLEKVLNLRSELEANLKYAPFIIDDKTFKLKQYIIKEGDAEVFYLREESEEMQLAVLVVPREGDKDSTFEIEDLPSNDKWNKIKKNTPYLHIQCIVPGPDSGELHHQLLEAIKKYLANPDNFSQVQHPSFTPFYHSSSTAPFPRRIKIKGTPVGCEVFDIYLAPQNDIIDGGIVECSPRFVMNWHLDDVKELLKNLKKCQDKSHVEDELKKISCSMLFYVNVNEIWEAKNSGDDKKLVAIVNKLLRGDETGVNLVFFINSFPYYYRSYDVISHQPTWDYLEQYAFYLEAQYIRREGDRMAHILQGGELYILMKHLNNIPKSDILRDTGKLTPIIIENSMNRAIARLLGPKYFNFPGGFLNEKLPTPFVAKYTMKIKTNDNHYWYHDILIKIMMQDQETLEEVSRTIRIDEGTVTLLAPKNMKIVSVEPLTPGMEINYAYLTYYVRDQIPLDSEQARILGTLYRADFERWNGIVTSSKSIDEVVVVTFNLWNRFNHLFGSIDSNLEKSFSDRLALCRLKLIVLLSLCCTNEVDHEKFQEAAAAFREALDHFKFDTQPEQKAFASIQEGLEIFKRIRRQLLVYTTSPVLFKEYFLNFSWTKTFSHLKYLLCDYIKALATVFAVPDQRMCRMLYVNEKIPSDVLTQWAIRQSTYFNPANPTIDFIKSEYAPGQAPFYSFYCALMPYTKTDAHISLVGQTFPTGADIIQLLADLDFHYILKVIPKAENSFSEQLLELFMDAPYWLQYLVLKQDGERSILKHPNKAPSFHPTSYIGQALINYYGPKKMRTLGNIYRSIVHGRCCVRCGEEPLKEGHSMYCHCTAVTNDQASSTDEERQSTTIHQNCHGYCPSCHSILTKASIQRQRVGSAVFYAGIQERALSHCFLHLAYPISSAAIPPVSSFSVGSRNYRMASHSDSVVVSRDPTPITKAPYRQQTVF